MGGMTRVHAPGKILELARFAASFAGKSSLNLVKD